VRKGIPDHGGSGVPLARLEVNRTRVGAITDGQGLSLLARRRT
jgi:hypothetical protein